MDNPFDLVVTLELGGRRRVVTARQIAHELGEPGLAVQLVALALASTTRDDQAASEASVDGPGVTRNAYQENTSTRTRNAVAPDDAGHTSADANDSERVAAHLAMALRDEQSLGYYRLVARAVPREVIRDALERALGARSIRKSRAALFTHIVRPHLPRSRTTPPIP